MPSQVAAINSELSETSFVRETFNSSTLGGTNVHSDYKNVAVEKVSHHIYLLVMTNITMENHHFFQLENPLLIAIFHGNSQWHQYVSVPQIQSWMMQRLFSEVFDPSEWFPKTGKRMEERCLKPIETY